MVAQSSRIVAVRSAIIDGLKMQDDLRDEPVQITYQYQPKTQKREHIYTTDATFSHEPAAMRSGRNFRDEIGRFNLIIAVEGLKRSAEWCAQRALERGVVVETFIADRKNNELDVTGLQTLLIDGDGSLVELFGDSGHLAIITYPIRYTARLQ